MIRTVEFHIPFSRGSKESNWTLVISREPDCPTVTFGLLWGTKTIFSHATEEPIEDVIAMFKELTDAGE